MSSGFYQYITSFIGTGSIWNTCYLEYSYTLLVSASFTSITYYLYTIGFLVYLHDQSTLIPQSNTYWNTFYSYEHGVTSISTLQFDLLHILLDSIFAPTSLYLYILKPRFACILNMATTTRTVILDTTADWIPWLIIIQGKVTHAKVWKYINPNSLKPLALLDP